MTQVTFVVTKLGSFPILGILRQAKASGLGIFYTDKSASTGGTSTGLRLGTIRVEAGSNTATARTGRVEYRLARASQDRTSRYNTE